MFKYRAISFPILLGIFFLICFWSGGRWIFLVLAAAASCGLTLELFRMMGNLQIPGYAKAAAAVMTLTAVSVVAAPALAGIPLLLGGAALMLTVLPPDNREEAVRKLFGTLGGFFLAIMLILPVLGIYAMRDGMLFLYFVLVTKAMDTGGYIFGMLSNRWMPGGNHKIFPRISPKKSWEGTVGGILFSIGAAFLIWKCAGTGSLVYAPVWWVILSGILLAVGSMAGDLTESAFKRAAGIKDSANYIPGMGGVFDVLDSFIYNGWLFAVLMPLLMR
ncbi:MAG: phosphatidate cytidylyltransferase [Lentisphaeria bacterium]|nr:phosphatidate cytidylyltransferase [Lentisphaeria bacterium]